MCRSLVSPVPPARCAVTNTTREACRLSVSEICAAAAAPSAAVTPGTTSNSTPAYRSAFPRSRPVPSAVKRARFLPKPSHRATRRRQTAARATPCVSAAPDHPGRLLRDRLFPASRLQLLKCLVLQVLRQQQSSDLWVGAFHPDE